MVQIFNITKFKPRPRPWNLFPLVALLLAMLSHSNDASKSPDTNLGSLVIIVNTVDGSFVGIDVSSGKELWKILGPPLVSQSLSDLRFVTADSDYTIVPSLDGQLYLLEKRTEGGGGGASLKALPLTVDSLFSSNFMLTENSVLTGVKDNSLFAFNPLSGRVRYNCSRDGCAHEPSFTETGAPVSLDEALILVYCVNHVVRAVHIPTGIERWNLSVRQHDLCLIHDSVAISSTALQKRLPTCIPSAEEKHSNDHPDSSRDPLIVAKHPNYPEFEFGLDQLLIVARTKSPFSRLLWSYQLESRIAKAWIYSSNPNLLEPLRLFIPQSHQQDDLQASLLADRLHSDQIRLTARVNEVSRKKTLSDFIFGPKIGPPKHYSRDPECPSRDRLVYLGQVDRNLYVQLEDNSDLPNPSQITLSQFDRPDSTHASTSASSSSESSQFALVGYYRATYASHAADEICLQPFVSSSRRLPSRPVETDQRALVPWRPMSLMDKWANNPDHTPSSSDPNALKHTEAFSDWVFESTRDLFTLLLRASELSDRSNVRSSRRDSPPIVWWDRFSHTVHLCLLICVLYLADRLFRLFHGNGDLYLAALTDHPKQPNVTEANPDVSFQCDACSTPNHTDDNANGQSNEDAKNGVSQPGASTDDNAPRERRLSVSCGTQAAPVFISVYETEFKFVRCLGRGAFGRVFEVENRFDGCRYAIKRIEVKEVDGDEKRFLREVRVLASLDHPGIVRYHRAWSEHPPPGWQIARDMALFGSSDDDTGADTGCSWDDYSIRQTSDCESGRAGNMRNKIDNSSRFAPFKPDLGSEISGSDVRLSLNRRLDESLIVFQRDTASDSGSCAQNDQSVTSSVISGSLANRTNRRSKRSRTTSTSEPNSNTSWYLYIQMQLCSQMSLRDWLSSKNHATSRPERVELYYMFWQIVDAVAYLHAHELMHRDLKPSNILFDSANRLKLADFGLVTSFADEDVNMAADYGACAGTGDVAGTPGCTSSASELVSSQKADDHGDSGHADSWSSGNATDLSSNHIGHKYFGLRAARRQHTNDVGTDLYMSPEQERHERYDRKVDIFSLGLIFLELLLPFETDMERICTLLRAKRQILPEEFTRNHPAESALIRSLLDPNPHGRPSAADLVHDPLLSQAKSDQPHLLSCTTNIALRTVV